MLTPPPATEKDLAELQKAADEIRKDLSKYLEKELVGGGGSTTRRGPYASGSGAPATDATVRRSAPPAPPAGGEVQWCCVCGRTDRPMERRSQGYKCMECRGRQPSQEVIDRFSAIGLHQPGGGGAQAPPRTYNKVQAAAPSSSASRQPPLQGAVKHPAGTHAGGSASTPPEAMVWDSPRVCVHETMHHDRPRKITQTPTD